MFLHRHVCIVFLPNSPIAISNLPNFASGNAYTFIPKTQNLNILITIHLLFSFLVVDCGDPGHPGNGLTTATGGFTYGNDVTFSCNLNYVFEGSLLATCQSDGKWSKSLPNCLGEKNRSLDFYLTYLIYLFTIGI